MRLRWIVAPFATALLFVPSVGTPAPMGFVATVKSTNPIAYFRLTQTTGQSEVGTATYQVTAGAQPSGICAPVGVPNNSCEVLNGTTAYFNTTQTGGIAGAGSEMAWAKLNVAPQKIGHIAYVAGISENGNDFDLQFETNALRFFTASGSHVEYAANPATLVGQWHMIVATFDTVSKVRAIYWDGKLAASDHGGGLPNKTRGFEIGESEVFTGRFFPGVITDVALWNRALSAQTVAAIYASRLHAP